MKLDAQEVELFRIVELLNDTCNLLAKKMRQQNLEIRRLRRLVGADRDYPAEKKRVN